MRRQLAAMTAGERVEQSGRVAQRLSGLRVWREARWVGGFVPMPDEPQLWELFVGFMETGRRLALPRWDAGTGTYLYCAVRDPRMDLVAGRYGILEPRPECAAVPVTLLDLMVVPGLAFDRDGRRLGRGKGFYDRLLESVAGVSCGVGLEGQLVPTVPVEPHDKRLNLVVMPCGPYGPAAHE